MWRLLPCLAEAAALAVLQVRLLLFVSCLVWLKLLRVLCLKLLYFSSFLALPCLAEADAHAVLKALLLLFAFVLSG